MSRPTLVLFCVCLLWPCGVRDSLVHAALDDVVRFPSPPFGAQSRTRFGGCQLGCAGSGCGRWDQLSRTKTEVPDGKCASQRGPREHPVMEVFGYDFESTKRDLDTQVIPIFPWG